MDLKGSLVDTNLKIYPSIALMAFLQKIDVNQCPHVPENIVKLSNNELTPSHKEQSSGKEKKPSVYLNDEDLKQLVNIKKYVSKNITDEPMENGAPNIKAGISMDDDDSTSEPECDSDEQSSSSEKDDDDETNSNSNDEKMKLDKKESKSKLNKPKIPEKPFLFTTDIDWLYDYIQRRIQKGEKDIPYLHNLLEGCPIKFPKNKLIKRNPELEARCVKLRAQQEAREYRKMTKGVDNVRIRYPEDSIAYQLKSMNRQLIAIGQFILSIFAGFLFGFRGVEWMVGNLDFGFRLLLGVMCALIIALAEIYFLAKKLNEELHLTETVQIGGPAKFPEPPLRKFHDPKELEKVLKEHED